MKWYVLQFSATRYSSVCALLERREISYFCPMITEKYRRPDKVAVYRERQTPAFPGYLFVNIDFEVVHSTVLTSLPNVHRFISFGTEPLVVPVGVIESLIERNWSSNVPQKKSIPHRFAEILLMEDPLKRSISFINYVTECSLTHRQEMVEK